MCDERGCLQAGYTVEGLHLTVPGCARLSKLLPSILQNRKDRKGAKKHRKTGMRWEDCFFPPFFLPARRELE